jgi:hypothetical protein
LTSKKKTEEQLVRIAPLGELRAYTISEHELEKLEQGAPVSDLFTIGLCLLSCAVTILATLLSASLSGTTLTLFFCTLLITGLIGGICTFLGWHGRINTRDLAREIRARLPAVPAVQQVSSAPVTAPPTVQTSSQPPLTEPPPVSPPPPINS